MNKKKEKLKIYSFGDSGPYNMPDPIDFSAKNNKKKISISQYALYVYYLQRSGEITWFENHPEGKLKAIKELLINEGIDTTPKYFQIKYNLINNYNTNRIAKNQIPNISYVIENLLSDYPRAKEIAIKELEEAHSKSK
ncbi:MAG: hypothetical protein KDE33_00800 [Bacteroidetes bacterium]|nr:hypothetical protein [Bacteroidota bacterium]